MTADTVLQFKKMLMHLEGWMAKAAAHADNKKFDVNNFCTLRLAPDMFPFTKQIQSSCDAAKFCAAYLSGQTAPKHEDSEVTWNELRERVRKVVTYLEGFKTDQFANSATLKVTPGWAKGQWISGSDYVAQVAVPNFYFHITTAYVILRHAGVDVGKMDFLGQPNLHS
jgi:hypothetical protein